MLGSKKQVLLVGNDGVQLYVVDGKRVSLYADYSDAGVNLSSELRTAFKEIKAPLILLFDVVEQQYRKEPIPNVSMLDKNKVIQRKLMMAFPQQQMRAFLPMKQKPKEGDGLVALFAGLASNLTITQIMDAILGSEVAVQGAGLLPMESTTLIKKMVDELHKKSNARTGTRWSVLMTYHKTGGLRQVVTKDNELALTRLTPLAVNPENTAALAEEMAREFSATLTYLARFGYVPTDGLDLIIVSSEAVCDEVQRHNLAVSNLYSLPLYQVGQVAGVTPVSGHDAGPYADALHAGWLGLQRKLVMPLTGSTLDKIKSARQTAQIAIFGMILTIGYVGFQVFTLQSSMMALKQETSTIKAQQIALQTQHDELAQKLNTLKHPPEATKQILDIYDKFSTTSLNPEPLLELINSAIDKEKIQVKSFAIEPAVVDPLAAVPDPSDPDANKPMVTATLTIAFNNDVSVESGASATNYLMESLKTRLPKWTIDVKEMIGNLSIDKTIQGASAQVTGTGGNSDNKENTSTLILKGRLE